MILFLDYIEDGDEVRGEDGGEGDEEAEAIVPNRVPQVVLGQPRVHVLP